MSFNIGSVVRLNSGGPLMTITSTSVGENRPTLFICNWYNTDNRQQTGSYPVDALVEARATRSMPGGVSVPRRRGGSGEGGTGWMGR
jgi:uncharacterized protein YodC (DUF2158 family)